MALPDYVKRAKNTYNSKFDLIQLKLPKGTKERIKMIIGEDRSMAAFCVDELLEVIAGYEVAASYQQPEDFSEPVPEVSEPKAEPQKELSESVEKVEGKPKKAEFKPITPEEAAELQALIDGKKEDEKRAKEKVEQEKKALEEAEQAAKEAEIMGYVERMRDAQEGIREARSEQDKKKIAAVLADAELLAIIREPSNRDCLVDQIGEDLYNAILQADREKQRRESIDRANAEMGQTNKPPF